MEAASSPVRCVVADDHPSVLTAVCAYLIEEGVDVIARARNGHEALELIKTMTPAVAVVDLRMPGLTGIEVAREVTRLGLTTAVIVFTGDAERAHLVDAVGAGVRGLVLKEGPLKDLVRAVGIVAAGGTYVDTSLAGTFATAGTTDKQVELTEREREVLGLLARGRSYEQIAAELSSRSGCGPCARR